MTKMMSDLLEICNKNSIEFLLQVNNVAQALLVDERYADDAVAQCSTSVLMQGINTSLSARLCDFYGVEG